MGRRGAMVLVRLEPVALAWILLLPVIAGSVFADAFDWLPVYRRWLQLTLVLGASVLIGILDTPCVLVAIGGSAAVGQMAYRALARIQDAPTRPIRPDPEIWRHLSTLRLYEAACLLADIEPNKSKIDEPGDVNGWYRALCDAIRDNEIFYIYSILDDDRTTQYGYLPHPDTVITREDLNKFSTSRNLRRAFLS